MEGRRLRGAWGPQEMGLKMETDSVEELGQGVLGSLPHREAKVCALRWGGEGIMGWPSFGRIPLSGPQYQFGSEDNRPHPPDIGMNPPPHCKKPESGGRCYHPALRSSGVLTA